jgi:16S rRNA (cytidine1402-2'-O)-methyltransferase
MQIQKAPYNKGTIYLVGVPIGNIDDISYRAVKTLKKADLIFAEDTRRAKNLLQNLDIINKQVFAHHEHNEQASAKGIIELALEGNDIAFVSDAGMPAIADPGFVLGKAALENDINIVPISGPCAAIMGLVGSGLSTSSFTFLGFLPRNESGIIKKLEEYKAMPETLIFYESPKRIIKTLKALETALGDRQICLAREITKIYEEYIRGTVSECIKELESRDKVLGEFCVVVDKPSKEDLIVTDEVIIADIKKMIEQNETAKTIKNTLSEKYNINKKHVYNLYLDLV